MHGFTGPYINSCDTHFYSPPLVERRGGGGEHPPLLSSSSMQATQQGGAPPLVEEGKTRRVRRVWVNEGSARRVILPMNPPLYR